MHHYVLLVIVGANVPVTVVYRISINHYYYYYSITCNSVIEGQKGTPDRMVHGYLPMDRQILRIGFVGRYPRTVQNRPQNGPFMGRVLSRPARVSPIKCYCGLMVSDPQGSPVHGIPLFHYYNNSE